MKERAWARLWLSILSATADSDHFKKSKAEQKQYLGPLGLTEKKVHSTLSLSEIDVLYYKIICLWGTFSRFNYLL